MALYCHLFSTTMRLEDALILFLLAVLDLGLFGLFKHVVIFRHILVLGQLHHNLSFTSQL